MPEQKDMGENVETLSTELLDVIARHKMGPWSSIALSKFKIKSNKPYILVVDVEVDEKLSNSYGNLHGGALATLIEVLTSLAAYALNPQPSVTIDLHVTCVSNARTSTKITFECQVERKGKSIVFTSCRVLGNTGQLVAIASHTKKIIGAKASPNDLDGLRSRL
jgi:acyl-coenzyme A thioesterase 13